MDLYMVCKQRLVDMWIRRKANSLWAADPPAIKPGSPWQPWKQLEVFSLENPWCNWWVSRTPHLIARGYVWKILKGGIYIAKIASTWWTGWTNNGFWVYKCPMFRHTWIGDTQIIQVLSK
jgi:hypothetical protein